LYGGKSGKITDSMLDTIAELVRKRDATLAQMELIARRDPTLEPFMDDLRVRLQ
jgi:hypothetical protein